MRRYLILALILLLAAALRLVYLGRIPGGISPDEISQGYSAYSILRTGKDEWGMAFPITSFRSFLDYKAVLQTYLMIGSIALFGLSEFSVRLPSAIFGILAVVAVYLLSNELFERRKFKFLGLDLTIGDIAAFFLAISPWHLQFSRTALEVNLSSFLFPLGLYLFLLSLKRPRFLYLAALTWGLNLYTYHAAKYFEPLFFVGLLILFGKQIMNLKKSVLIGAALLTVVIASPLLFATVFGQAGDRAKDLLITQINPQAVEGVAKLQYFSPLNRVSLLIPRAFANKGTYVINQFVNNYVSYLSPSFWFTEGGREITYSVLPGTGLLYLWLFPLILIGLYRLVKEKNPRLSLLLLWLFLAIIPAALTKEGYRPNRVGALLTFWEILSAYGLFELVQTFHFMKRKYLSVIFLSLSSLITVFYFNTYFFEYPFKYPSALSYGYRELVNKLSQSTPTSVIMDKGSNSQAFFAFYEKIDPRDFQQAAALWWEMAEEKHPLYLDMLEQYQLKNVTFKSFNPRTDLVDGNLVAIPAEKMSDSYLNFVQDRVLYPDQSVAFYILQNNEK